MGRTELEIAAPETWGGIDCQFACQATAKPMHDNFRFDMIATVMCVILNAAVLMAACGCAFAHAPDPGRYSSAQYDVDTTLGNLIAMRDGVRLSVDIYRPTVSGVFPSLLMITPYNNNGSWVERAKLFAKRGYVVALADTRGRYDSEGEWDPFSPKQKTDGYDLVEWIANQLWSNGRVGMYGPSYMGWETWWTATQAPPHLRAIVAEVAPPDPMYNIPYQQGVISGWVLDWQAGMGGRTSQMIGSGPYRGFAARRAKDLTHTPYIELNHLRGVMNAPWLETWLRENVSTAEYWRAISYQTPESYSKVTVPSLAVTGWFDSNHPGAPMNYLGMRRYGSTPEARNPRLVIGPWTHWPIGTRYTGGVDYGPTAIVDWDGYITRWFDHYLKGVDNGLENDQPVHVFVMGANKWRAENAWPLLQTKWTKFYFESGGRANSLKGDGKLSYMLPKKNRADTYAYDPKNPTRSAASSNGHLDGAVDTRLSAIGDDVLVYQTAPLAAAIEVTGPIEVVLYAATSARDTDWFVRLVDVQPDARSLLLAEGALRARTRDPARRGLYNSERLSLIEPGEVYEYTIKFWRGTANLFQQGHRIRVEISSSWFPYFVPNLNTGSDNIAFDHMRDAVVAKQTIHHGPKYPSHILLPVIPASGRHHEHSNQ